MYRHRLRSPLRLLSATMSALMVVGLAAIVGPWFIAFAPVVAGLFLLAPPIGIYRHDETPVSRTGVHLAAFELGDNRANTLRFRLALINPGHVPAQDFRIRLLVPHTVVPAHMSSRLLGPLLVGSLGSNWFIDSTADAIAITFRAGDADAITCNPGETLNLADLNLPRRAVPFDISLEYQVSGGSTTPALDRLRLRAE